MTAVRSAFAGDARGQLALMAACEVEAIATAMQRRFCRDDCPPEAMQFRGLAIRLEKLAGAILTCLEDDAGDIEDVRREIQGPELSRERGAVGP